MKNIVIFASGSGSNAENIINYFAKSATARVVAVFCNAKNAGVLERAERLNVPSELFSKEDFLTPLVMEKLKNYQPDLVVLAGFLAKIPADIITAFPNKIIKIHPALLPKYGGKGMYGMHVHRAVAENRDPETGISVHFVNEHYDEGNIIAQHKVALYPEDRAEEIAAKIHRLEQEFFPIVVEEVLRKQ